jgi:hypothetical protein
MTEHTDREPFEAPKPWWGELLGGYAERLAKEFERWVNRHFGTLAPTPPACDAAFAEGTSEVCRLANGGRLYCEDLPDGTRRYWTVEPTHSIVVWDTRLTSVPTVLAALLHEERIRASEPGGAL